MIITACSDYALKNEIKTGPEIVVHPTSIDFGNLLSGQESGQESFAVINAGDEDLIINKPAISNDFRFSISDSLNEEYIIQPGNSVEFNIYYNPETYENNNATITIQSNDEDEEYLELPVTGNGDAPLLSIEPPVLYFGDISIGCSIEETITLRNNGNLNLIVSDVTQMATLPTDIVADFGSLPNLPWELVPGQELDFNILYEPTDINLDESQITVNSNDPVNSEVIIVQEGYGDIVHWFHNRYIQDESKIVDIVFVVDNSGSMNDQQQELAYQMNDFVSILQNMNVDYHLGFITTDSAMLQQYDGYDWIDNRHPDPVMWAANVINSIGTGGSPFEKGIYYAQAFSSFAASSSSYWRPNSNFVIVYISDEPDYSPNSYTSYFPFFDNIKPSPSLVRQFAVIGDYPSGCLLVNSANGTSYNVPFGGGYYEMTQRYNGQAYSICAPDWGIQMQNLATAVSVRASFEMSERNVMENTIEVRVNGQLSYEWIYDEATNSIIFNNEYIPDGGNTVEIDYAILGCGE